MAKTEDFPSVTPFSKAIGAALREVMSERGVTQEQVGHAIDRRQSYVSERLRGLRAPDTDIIAGIASVAEVDPRTIVREVLTKIRPTSEGTVTPIRPDASARRPTVTPKVAKRSPESAGASEFEE